MSGASQEERKEATRRAIIGAALKLLDERSFSAVSLREVTRAANIVPAAFYRHFESMDTLGLMLIDESFRALCETLRDARAGGLDPQSDHRILGRHPDGERPRPACVLAVHQPGALHPMIVIAEALADAPDARALTEIKQVAVEQLRMISVAATGWRSSP